MDIFLLPLHNGLLPTKTPQCFVPMPCVGTTGTFWHSSAGRRRRWPSGEGSFLRATTLVRGSFPVGELENLHSTTKRGAPKQYIMYYSPILYDYPVLQSSIIRIPCIIGIHYYTTILHYSQIVYEYPASQSYIIRASCIVVLWNNLYNIDQNVLA